MSPNNYPLVEILLATYNGEKYIREQLDSILNQTYKNIRILIHDDGSSDNTVYIIKEYEKNYPDKIVFIDDGIKTGGAVWNFEHLMKHATAEYIMFSDQDDIWLPDKIEISLKEVLELEKKYGKETPILVYTDAIVIDEKKNVLSKSFWKYTKIKGEKISLGRSLETSLGLGCTMMINNSLLKKSIPFSKNTIAHDMWVSMVGVCFGKVKYINKGTLLYRQHSSNVSGAEKSNLITLIKKALNPEDINRFRENYYKKRIQASSFLEIYKNSFSKKQIKTIETYINLPKLNPITRIHKIISEDIFWTGNIRDFFRMLLRWTLL